MRVGIDARTVERAEDLRGIGVVVGHLIQHLLAQGVDVVLFYSRTPDNAPAAARAKQVVLGPASWAHPARLFRPLLDFVWEQLLLPPALARERLDLYHAPANRGIPLMGTGRFVSSINDVIPLVTPYFFDRRTDPPLVTSLLRLALWVSLALVARRARRIMTLSECSRRDIERLFPWARRKITVIRPGADPRYRRVEDRGEVSRVIERHGLPHRFLLYVGGLGQRKNITGLLRAYALVVRRMPDAPALVVVGRPNALYPALRRTADTLEVADRVRFPGFVPTDDLPALLSTAELLAYPSFYEGFGLPVVEAMACGCPVICSQTSSLPEVGGSAVLYCNPASPEDLADKMYRVLTDRTLRADLIEQGLRRAREFSMDRMAAEVLQMYREVLADGAGGERAAAQPPS